MAKTTAAIDTTSLIETIYTTSIGSNLLRELRPAMFMRPFFRQAGALNNTLSHDYLLLDGFLATSIETNKIESEVFTAVEQTTSNARVTAALAGTMSVTGDVVRAVSVIDVMSEVAGNIQRAFAQKWETAATANLANFSNTTTAAAGQLSVYDVLAAIAALEQRDVTAEYVFGGHTKQLADLRQEQVGLTGVVWYNQPNQVGHYRDNWGELFGTPMYASTAVSSSGGNYQGAVFASGEALGYAELWAPKVELWRDARSLITYTVLSSVFGSCEVSDTRGQTVLSSTT